MKITTLIPAYKHRYILALMSSLKNQTIKPDRIIISDDSVDGEYRRIFYEKYDFQDLSVEFIDGPRNGGYENFKHLIKYWAGSSELVHIMLDDDVIFPHFYEKHLLAHSSASISCSISARWNADQSGDIISGQEPPSFVVKSNNKILILDSDFLFQTTIAESKNWLGEFSNTVMRSEATSILLKPELAGISYAGLWDLGFFVTASLIKPIGYISEYLGYFRNGGDNNTSNKFGVYMKSAFIAYAALTLAANKEKYITLDQAKKCYMNLAYFIGHHYNSQVDMIHFEIMIAQLADNSESSDISFVKSWCGFLKRNAL